MSTESRVSIDLSDNDELKAYLNGKQPGDDYCITVKGKIVENSDQQFVGDVASVVEDDDEDSDNDGDNDEADAEQGDAGDSNPDAKQDAVTSGGGGDGLGDIMGAVMSKTMQPRGPGVKSKS